METDEKMEVTDKRRVHAEAGAGSASPTDETPEEEQMLPPMDVYGLLKTTISLLSNAAWAWMGLTPSPFTGQMEKDLNQAKIAIDSVAYLAGQVESHLGDAERREMQNVVSMLRVNYVQQLSNS
jgi:hypothetical protein